MIVAIAGLLLVAAVCIFSLLVAGKAQQGLRQSRYQSMMPYGKEMQAAQDKSELRRFGLPQLLPRRAGGLSAAGMSMNAMGMAGAAALLFGPALAAGGPTVVGVGLPLVALVSLCVSASLAELASGVPTAGGVYHAAYQLGGRKWGIRAGWLQVAGYAAKLALLIGGFAYLADALLASRLGYESTGLTFFAAAAIGSLTQAAMCQYGSGIANKVQAGGVWLQTVIVLAALAGLAWLFWPGDYSPLVMYQWLDSGMDRPAQPLMFTLGLLLLAGMFTGMDGAAHGAEETIEPRVRVPWAIFLSTAYTYIGLFVLLFFMTLVTLPAGEPTLPASSLFGGDNVGAFMQYAFAAAGGSYWLPVLVVLSLWQSGQQTMTACSRAVFSLARDEALPFGRRLASISFHRQLPLSSIWSVAIVALLLLAGAGLLQSEGAFLPLLSATIVALHLAVAIPIGLGWLADKAARRAATRRAKPSSSYTSESLPPWHVGSWRFPIRTAALAWLLLSAILSAGIIHPFGGIFAAAVMLAVTATAGVRSSVRLDRVKKRAAASTPQSNLYSQEKREQQR